ncbi:MAG TPA: peptidoglycan-binding protein [Limnochordia bacterium]|jgi:peptidoglycan hydrolase-like protein with peptidoglycan-binding domain|nr:peptidoglycan-binding protein [Limnochordia bacterium]HXK98005.1 peptidoglycan-binding protein [Limnochordia bacterium]
MLGRKRRVKLGARVLKLGSCGGDVSLLQQRLKEFGYEPGPVDGIFGYLTQEALQFFQRDYRLKIDGIAGKEVFTLLNQAKLPIARRVHIVQPGETLGSIADQYQVGPEAFFDHHKKSIYPGQELVFYDREVWGVLTEGLQAQESLAANQESLTGVFFPMNPEKGVPRYVQAVKCPKVAQVVFDEAELISVHSLLSRRKMRRSFLRFCRELADKVDGVWLGWEHISRVDGYRYHKLLRSIKRQIGPLRLIVTLTCAMPRWNILGGIDFAAVGGTADQVVVKPPIPEPGSPILDKGRCEQMLHRMLNYVPAYKILLSVPVHALLWNQAEPGAPQRLSCGEAKARAFRHGARQETDSCGTTVFHFIHQQKEWTLRIPSLEQVNQCLTLVNRYNLAGIVIDRMGEEDKRLWARIRNHFCISKHM